ncbi:MAG: hypothetical protein RIQ53_4194 [Pseudomonadota bacterium]|jgi:hypothetical protein
MSVELHPSARWITTASGASVLLDRPDPASLQLSDMAHALGQIPRYCGHARRPYSVAEHSILVAQIIEAAYPDARGNPHAGLAALMHDAHEAYIGDLSTPAKGILGEPWALYEERMQRAVRTRYGLHQAAVHWAPILQAADRIALATERAQLLPDGPLWPCLMHVQPMYGIDLMAPERCAMTWQDWACRWADEVEGAMAARAAMSHPVEQHA